VAAFLKPIPHLGQTFIIFAEIEKRQLAEVPAAGASRKTFCAFMLLALFDRT
jgi:hypothetical protein